MSPDTPTRTPAPARPATETRPEVSTEDGDHDRFAHYIRKSDWERAYVEGKPVRALCGKLWVPSRDPDRYEVCQTCKKIKAAADI